MYILRSLKQSRVLAPLLCPLALAAGIGGALHGYEPPVYEAAPPIVAQTQEEEPLFSMEDMLSIPVTQPEENALGLPDGIYEGTGTGFGGAIRVAVAVQEGRILQADVLEAVGEDEEFLARAQNILPRIVAAQSTDVELISGATKSCKGILQGVRVALGQERVPVPRTAAAPEPGLFTLPDGIYTGSAEGYRGPITAAVVVQDQQLRAVLIRQSEDDSSFLARASVLTRTVVENQSLAVDTIAGATYSSQGILQAIANALESPKEALLPETALPSQPEVKDSGEKAEADLLPEQDFSPPAEELPPAVPPEAEPCQRLLSQWSAWLKKRLCSSAKSAADPPAEQKDASTLSPSLPEVEVFPAEMPTAPALGYTDGMYTASATCEPDEYLDFYPYEITVTIQIEQGRIAALPTVGGASGDNLWYFNRALRGSGSVVGLQAQLLQKGCPEGVDLVSEATCSSRAILAACEAALQQAVPTEEGAA